jgi:hypothetical protein
VQPAALPAATSELSPPAPSLPAPSLPAPSPQVDDQPLRFLLIRTKAGELPWLARTMAQVMAPVEIVQVVGMANALWRLGHERFDSVLLDVDLTDRWVVRRCREQIADIAAVPVLDLADRPEAKAAPAVVERPSRRPDASVGAEPARQTLRLPWQRRPKRSPATPQPVIATVV